MGRQESGSFFRCRDTRPHRFGTGRINRNSASEFYGFLRLIIAEQLARQMPKLHGEIEVDESYFGGHRKGKRGRGAAGKVPVFGLLKRNGYVYTQIVPDAREGTLMPIIRDKIKPGSILYSDCFRPCDVLDVSAFHRFRINHSKQFADRNNHINGIENFWNQAKRRLRVYNDIPRKNFHLFLEECEFCFNYGTVKEQLTTLRKWVKLSASDSSKS